MLFIVVPVTSPTSSLIHYTLLSTLVCHPTSDLTPSAGGRYLSIYFLACPHSNPSYWFHCCPSKSLIYSSHPQLPHKTITARLQCGLCGAQAPQHIFCFIWPNVPPVFVVWCFSCKFIHSSSKVTWSRLRTLSCQASIPICTFQS